MFHLKMTISCFYIFSYKLLYLFGYYCSFGPSLGNSVYHTSLVLQQNSSFSYIYPKKTPIYYYNVHLLTKYLIVDFKTSQSQSINQTSTFFCLLNISALQTKSIEVDLCSEIINCHIALKIPNCYVCLTYIES